MTQLGELGELGLLDRLLRHLDTGGGDLVVGAGGDDAAAWRNPGGGVTVATCDSFVEGVHFDLSWMDPETAGWRAAALTLADLAAKAAPPTYGLVALAAPRSAPLAVVEGIYAGLSACAVRHGLRLAGGDTSRTAGPIVVTVFALGASPEPPVPRSAVRPGWWLGVTGPLGGEAAALAARRPSRPGLRGFEDRLQGMARGDISDGLARELLKFRQAAGVGAVVDASRVPVATGATLEQALSGGEETEFVCAWPGGERPGVVTIGRFTEGGIIEGVGGGGGYDHFG